MYMHRHLQTLYRNLHTLYDTGVLSKNFFTKIIIDEILFCDKMPHKPHALFTNFNLNIPLARLVSGSLSSKVPTEFSVSEFFSACVGLPFLHIFKMFRRVYIVDARRSIEVAITAKIYHMLSEKFIISGKKTKRCLFWRQYLRENQSHQDAFHRILK